jgi:hypothetical protein
MQLETGHSKIGAMMCDCHSQSRMLGLIILTFGTYHGTQHGNQNEKLKYGDQPSWATEADNTTHDAGTSAARIHHVAHNPTG